MVNQGNASLRQETGISSHREVNEAIAFVASSAKMASAYRLPIAVSPLPIGDFLQRSRLTSNSPSTTAISSH